MAPRRGPGLLHRLLILALFAWVSGVAPFMAQALHHGLDVLTAAYEDPCAGCPEDEESSDSTPCSPACSDCPCGPGSRLSPERAFVAWELPRLWTDFSAAAPMASGLAPPKDRALDGLLRPPRA